ncbi:hypothetical protein B0H19DRAFT_1064149 [Mycena capillaripes]|nr:hypothetical protein B0H19DRAFT_1064149 [Mycena capillaripes]
MHSWENVLNKPMALYSLLTLKELKMSGTPIGVDELVLNDEDRPVLENLVQLTAEYNNKLAERARFLANVGITSVRQALQEMFVRVTAGLVPDGKPVALSIFCVASRDYLALIESTIDTPTVFWDAENTEIPSLVAHLCRIGECSRIRWATNIPWAIALGQPRKKALDILENLKKRILKETTDVLDGIQDELQGIDKDLAHAVQQAVIFAPQVVEKFGIRQNTHWNTYKAYMRFDGIYPPYDLNRELTKGILPAIQSSWNLGMNHRIPLILKDSIMDIEVSTLTAMTSIVEALNGPGTTFRQAILAARDEVSVEIILSDLLEFQESIQAFSVAQRDGTRSFKTVVQDQLREQYQLVSQMSGVGFWARMKASNKEFFDQNSDNVFGPINTHIQGILHKAFGKVKAPMRAELEDLTTLIRLTLIENVNLSEGHKEAKDRILQLTMETRPTYAMFKIDLEDRRRSLGMS